MNQRLGQSLNQNVNDENATDATCQFLNIDVLQTLDLEDGVDGDKQVYFI